MDVAPARALREASVRASSGCRRASWRLSGARYVERPGTDGPLVDYWVYEDLYQSLKRAVTAAGRPRDEMTMTATTYEDVRPGCYDPVARLRDMDTNWTQASLSFPNFPRFCGQTFLEASDRDLALLCVRAYNDWMVEEWCGASDGRLVPLCIVPLWDPQLAAAEVERNAARGVRAVCFSEIPAYLGLPSIHSGEWDPFFAACEATGTVLVPAHRLRHEDAVDVGRCAARCAR